MKQHNLNFNNLLGEPKTVIPYFEILTGSPWIATSSFLIFGLNDELTANQGGPLSPNLIKQFIQDTIETQGS